MHAWDTPSGGLGLGLDFGKTNRLKVIGVRKEMGILIEIERFVNY